MARKIRRLLAAFVAALLVALSSSLAVAQSSEAQDPLIVVQGHPFHDWDSYRSSDLFFELGLRCNAPEPDPARSFPPSDCAYGSTKIDPMYDPSNRIEIPVVVHILEHSNGNGQISDALVQSQIDILNEDFLAIAGTPGGNGTDALIQFYLATVDPQGNPTNGITRTVNNQWYNDNGNYWDPLAWDTNVYMNVYTNTASGYLGYVPDLPQGGIVGSTADRIVVLWSAFGRDAPIGPPYDQGRTLTHEVGHYLGLWHPFDGGCGGGDCYQSGDAICDTNPEQQPTFGCPGNKQSCNSPDPVDNYMDYSDDLCMERFTPEQINRMRCTVEHWRPDLDQPQCDARVITRTGGTNPDALSATDPVLGGNVDIAVNGLGLGYSTSLLWAYTGSIETTLSNGSVLLVDLSSLKLAVLAGGPVASYGFSIPDDPALCSVAVFTQAAFFGGAPSFLLSNSQDLHLGY